jgi:hypothetical protein
MNRVNATISIIFALAIVIGFFIKVISPEAFMGLAGACIVFFFPKSETK